MTQECLALRKQEVVTHAIIQSIEGSNASPTLKGQQEAKMIAVYITLAQDDTKKKCPGNLLELPGVSGSQSTPTPLVDGHRADLTVPPTPPVDQVYQVSSTGDGVTPEQAFTRYLRGQDNDLQGCLERVRSYNAPLVQQWRQYEEQTILFSNMIARQNAELARVGGPQMKVDPSDWPKKPAQKIVNEDICYTKHSTTTPSPDYAANATQNTEHVNGRGERLTYQPEYVACMEHRFKYNQQLAPLWEQYAKEMNLRAERRNASVGGPPVSMDAPPAQPPQMIPERDCTALLRQ